MEMAQIPSYDPDWSSRLDKIKFKKDFGRHFYKKQAGGGGGVSQDVRRILKII